MALPLRTMAEGVQRPRPPPNRRRDKVQLSCGPCRHRKYVLEARLSIMHAQRRQIEMRPAATMRSMLQARPHESMPLRDDLIIDTLQFS